MCSLTSYWPEDKTQVPDLDTKLSDLPKLLTSLLSDHIISGGSSNIPGSFAPLGLCIW